ncbi:spore germination protein [Gorillibacterium massiliense]|uniref:spore germination protein n=1 Tax=Gorillibacterium massiliense TaxID=1280390 RepID=UPI0004B0561C|nr:spore germination protein [Gorillibacterium massiliense]
MEALTGRLPEDISELKTRMGESPDFIVRELVLVSQQHMAIFYVDGMVDKPALQDSILHPLLHRIAEDNVTLTLLQESILDTGEINLVDSYPNALDQIVAGDVLLLLEGSASGLLVAIPGWKDRSIEESKTQSLVRGPQDAFTETLRTNTTMIRRRIRDTRLRLTNFKIGKITKTSVTVMYLEGCADATLIANLTTQLNQIKVDRIIEGQYLEEILLLDMKPLTIFPRIYNTDRPDVIASGIMEGKIAILTDGTPFVLMLPALFTDFIQSAEDYYQTAVYGSLLRLLRYMSLFIGLLAPSIYIALTTFHQDMLPTQLLLSLAAQREGIPFPAFIEAMLMEITFEILREAGIRMPRAVGSAVSIVGTIVIGQAAVDASIVSPAMVIIVSITAIASFIIPAYTMSVPVRLLRFFFMGMAAILGVYGLTIGFIILTVHLCSLQSFGIPYMKPVAPFRKNANRDAIFRFPYRNRKQQTATAKGNKP